MNKFDSTRLGVDIFLGKRWCFPCNSKLLIPNYKLVVSFIQGPDNQSSIELRTGALIYSNYETRHLPVCEYRDSISAHTYQRSFICCSYKHCSKQLCCCLYLKRLHITVFFCFYCFYITVVLSLCIDNSSSCFILFIISCTDSWDMGQNMFHCIRMNQRWWP